MGVGVGEKKEKGVCGGRPSADSVAIIVAAGRWLFPNNNDSLQHIFERVS